MLVVVVQHEDPQIGLVLPDEDQPLPAPLEQPTLRLAQGGPGPVGHAAPVEIQDHRLDRLQARRRASSTPGRRW